jgi:ArsR family transcriptional regulator, arsenate/arsenite/antimonite-responsive transcriptional repressor
MTPRKTAVPIQADRRRGERCCDPSAKPTVRTADAERLTADLTILAHPIRLLLLDVLLHNEGRVCVCDLEAAVPVKQPTVSHHLRLLRAAGLVTSERDGLWAYYRVRREALAALRGRIEGALEELR